MSGDLLLVGERFNGIYGGGAERGDGGAEGRANQSQADGTDDPARREKNRQAGIGLPEDGLRQKGDENSNETADDGEKGGFPEEHEDDVKPGKAERFEDANFPSALEDHGVHVHEYDEETDNDPESHHC